MKSKAEIQIQELTKQVNEMKQEYEEAKQALEETKQEYENMITAMLKLPPRGVYL